MKTSDHYTALSSSMDRTIVGKTGEHAHGSHPKVAAVKKDLQAVGTTMEFPEPTDKMPRRMKGAPHVARKA